MSTCLLLFFVSCLVLQARAQSPEKSVEGSWQGALGEGAVRLRLVLTISKTSEGACRSVMDSVDERSRDNPGKLLLIQPFSRRTDHAVHVESHFRHGKS